MRGFVLLRQPRFCGNYRLTQTCIREFKIMKLSLTIAAAALAVMASGALAADPDVKKGDSKMVVQNCPAN